MWINSITTFLECRPAKRRLSIRNTGFSSNVHGREPLEGAGYSTQELEQSVGIYAGASMNTYLINQLMRNPDFVAKVGGYQIMLGNDKDYRCMRASYKLNLRGPSLTIQTACSTSLVAVAVACRALIRGDCDMALAGGVSVTFPQRMGYMFEEGMILSPDGHCRPFDIHARGTRPGRALELWCSSVSRKHWRTATQSTRSFADQRSIMTVRKKLVTRLRV